MSDRETLELAAKAAGIDWFDEPAAMAGKGLHMKSGPFWNPLENDGDALRLAVKLQMEIAIFDDECHTKCMERGQSNWTEEQGDPYAATRRAIVRAAAEIGRQMP